MAQAILNRQLRLLEAANLRGAQEGEIAARRGSIRNFIEQAVACRAESAFLEAISNYNLALFLAQPGDFDERARAEHLRNRAFCYQKKIPTCLPRALKDLQAAVIADDVTAELEYAKACVCSQMANSAEAIRSLTAYQRKRGLPADPLIQASLAFEGGDWVQAIRLSTLALDGLPGTPAAQITLYTERGIAYAASRQHEQAQQDFARAITLVQTHEPTNLSALIKLHIFSGLSCQELHQARAIYPIPREAPRIEDRRFIFRYPTEDTLNASGLHALFGALEQHRYVCQGARATFVAKLRAYFANPNHRTHENPAGKVFNAFAEQRYLTEGARPDARPRLFVPHFRGQFEAIEAQLRQALSALLRTTRNEQLLDHIGHLFDGGLSRNQVKALTMEDFLNYPGTLDDLMGLPACPEALKELIRQRQGREASYISNNAVLESYYSICMEREYIFGDKDLELGALISNKRLHLIDEDGAIISSTGAAANPLVVIVRHGQQYMRYDNAAELTYESLTLHHFARLQEIDANHIFFVESFFTANNLALRTNYYADFKAMHTPTTNDAQAIERWNSIMHLANVHSRDTNPVDHLQTKNSLYKMAAQFMLSKHNGDANATIAAYRAIHLRRGRENNFKRAQIQYEVGQLYRKQLHDYERAIGPYQIAKGMGHSGAYKCLGQMLLLGQIHMNAAAYVHGQATEADLAQAGKRLASADAHDPLSGGAAHLLGLFHYGVRKNYGEARASFTRAVEVFHYVPSNLALAWMNFRGHGAMGLHLPDFARAQEYATRALQHANTHISAERCLHHIQIALRQNPPRRMEQQALKVRRLFPSIAGNARGHVVATYTNKLGGICIRGGARNSDGVIVWRPQQSLVRGVINENPRASVTIDTQNRITVVFGHNIGYNFRLGRLRANNDIAFTSRNIPGIGLGTHPSVAATDEWIVMLNTGRIRMPYIFFTQRFGEWPLYDATYYSLGQYTAAHTNIYWVEHSHVGPRVRIADHKKWGGALDGDSYQRTVIAAGQAYPVEAPAVAIQGTCVVTVGQGAGTLQYVVGLIEECLDEHSDANVNAIVWGNTLPLEGSAAYNMRPQITFTGPDQLEIVTEGVADDDSRIYSVSARVDRINKTLLLLGWQSISTGLNPAVAYTGGHAIGIAESYSFEGSHIVRIS